MLPNLDIPIVLPLRIVFFQVLFLLVAIAIEAWVFRWGLNISSKKSVEYATVINLFSIVIGWLLFFNIQPFLPVTVRQELIAGILFNQWSGSIVSWFILAALVIFFASLVIKLIGLPLLRAFVGDKPLGPPELLSPQRNKAMMRRRDREIPRLNRQSNTILVANAASYTAISLVLALQLFAQNRFN